jgi:hypothetical protein
MLGAVVINQLLLVGQLRLHTDREAMLHEVRLLTTQLFPTVELATEMQAQKGGR